VYSEHAPAHPDARSLRRACYSGKHYLVDIGEELRALDRHDVVRRRLSGPEDSCSRDPFLCVLTPHGIPVEPASSLMIRQGGRLNQRALRLRSAIRILEPHVAHMRGRPSAANTPDGAPAGKLPPVRQPHGRSTSRAHAPKKRTKSAAAAAARSSPAAHAPQLPPLTSAARGTPEESASPRVGRPARPGVAQGSADGGQERRGAQSAPSARAVAPLKPPAASGSATPAAAQSTSPAAKASAVDAESQTEPPVATLPNDAVRPDAASGDAAADKDDTVAADKDAVQESPAGSSGEQLQVEPDKECEVWRHPSQLPYKPCCDG
jgi:hypothetical protein